MKGIKKISLSNVINKLSRNEMRYVMAGSGSTTCDCVGEICWVPGPQGGCMKSGYCTANDEVPCSQR